MKHWIILSLLSLGIHLGFGMTFYGSERPVKTKSKKVRVKVSVKQPKKKEIEIEQPKPEPPKAITKPKHKPKPKPKPKVVKKKPKPKPVARKPDKKPKKNAKRVQGLSAKSLGTKGNSSVSVPLGNTLMEKDKGLRLKADQIDALQQDLSADPKLIRASVQKPIYTEDALDAGIEGNFVVDVFVNSSGVVEEAELSRKVGFGMDKVLIEAAKKARFHPRRDKKGRPLSAWTFVSFALVIE